MIKLTFTLLTTLICLVISSPKLILAQYGRHQNSPAAGALAPRKAAIHYSANQNKADALSTPLGELLGTSNTDQLASSPNRGRIRGDQNERKTGQVLGTSTEIPIAGNITANLALTLLASSFFALGVRIWLRKNPR